MYLLKTAAATLVVALIPFLSAFSQGAPKPEQVQRITLTNEDFERICTLESTGVDAFYRLGPEEFQRRKSSNLKAADIQVDYANRSTWPSEAISAFEYAVSIWETYLDSDVPIRVGANWTPLGEFTLGSAGPSQIVQIDQGEPLTWYSIAHGSAVSGIDFVAQSQGTGSEVDYDVIVNMNSNWDSWYFGTDGQTPEGLIDFVTVVLHEIGHGIGFTGSMRVPLGARAEWGYGALSFPIIYDRFVIDGNGVSVLDREVYANPSNLLYDAVTGLVGGIYFAGITTIAANDGSPAPLYAPSDWNGGSSYSHLDLATYTNTENALMRPQIDRAFAVHTPGPVTCSIFGDMGWPLTSNCENLIGSDSQILLNEVEEESLNFGVTNVNSSAERVFRIANDADAQDLLVGRVGISGGNSFSVSRNVRILTLDPGESEEITVRFSPSVAGELTGELEIVHSGNNIENPIKITLRGEALPQGEVFVLEQNYPNPFNATTIIPYALSQTAEVKLDVFDALGRHIQTLVDGQQSPGRYNQPFRANDVSSGLFIYRIVVDGESETGKLLLVK